MDESIGAKYVWNGKGEECHEIYTNKHDCLYFLDGPGEQKTEVIFNTTEKRFELKDLGER